MRVIDFIQQLENQNLAGMLINKGVLSYKCFAYREYYKVFCSFRDAKPDMDRKRGNTWCAVQAAIHCKTSIRTIFAAIKTMEEQLPD